ncbi:MAG: hypothetical protein HQK77_19850 [Desulfobacterales bacterium]|nr:hypothetical protein [Desulfobacterales bacterium]
MNIFSKKGFVFVLFIISAIEISAAQAITIFNNFSESPVYNGPSAPTAFFISSAMNITQMMTYHFNGGRGSTPGTIFIRHSDGTDYGGK